MDGDSIDVVSMVDFWKEGVHQRIFGPCTDAHQLQTTQSAPHRDCVECLHSITPKVMYKVKQHSNICSKVEALVHSMGGNNTTEIY